MGNLLIISQVNAMLNRHLIRYKEHAKSCEQHIADNIQHP